MNIVLIIPLPLGSINNQNIFFMSKEFFERMGNNVAEAMFQYQMEKVETTSKEITEMLESYDFITDAFSDVEFLKELISIKISKIIIQNLIK